MQKPRHFLRLLPSPPDSCWKGEQLSRREMLPQQWAQPCGSQCTHKYAALTQIPWRVFCKKGCGADGDTWEECEIFQFFFAEGLSECEEICYKDPALKDQQWSAYIDRSPGAASYSEECFHACVSGCGYKFEIDPHKVDQIRPNRPCSPLPSEKPFPVPKPSLQSLKPGETDENIPCTSA